MADRETTVDYAHRLKEIANKFFPKAVKIRLVQDNINTHKPASLYEAFAPAEARRLVERFEWHYTPQSTALKGKWTSAPLATYFSWGKLSFVLRRKENCSASRRAHRDRP